ncbi:hypothetical protein BCR35DRAFT_279423 [Leucosporidium creatinivorum]|uniref:2-oxoadipate dioxygenase/decarboxylase n=1 Tax=Leucosporidium creatinivorum TaxID=106004 RepID=A0A1Y2F5X0_9BASI|nr:hypothetical protein BCR35DRAFT_279423 [Leucosporidium creatinivorum]
MPFVSSTELRQRFSLAMSEMYRKEVPLYGDLLDLVRDVNEPLLDTLRPLERSRLNQERHGAIRVGKEQELRNLARLFRQLGMHAVGYYDLSTAGLPVHATAFRATDASLLENPFRLFVSLLREDLITDENTRQLARKTLSNREIFSARALKLIAHAEAVGGVEEVIADEFITAALATFAFDRVSTVSEDHYTQLAKASPLVADIASFATPHINHLTPCTLDIDAVQRGMISRGIPPKSIIEGPPPRLCPILLRQTSFTALKERIIFDNLDPAASLNVGHHKARFGEIESRGAALTAKGRALFDELFEQARSTEVDTSATPHGDNAANDIHQAHLQKFFKGGFPDDWETLRKQGLIFVRYEVAEGQHSTEPKSLDELIAEGKVTFKGILYEDFLPASAAGIFSSNLGENKAGHSKGNPDQAGFEKSLGHAVLEAEDIYRTSEEQSLQEVRKAFPAVTL